MATMTVKDVLWRISGTLSDRSPQFKRFTEVDMVNALQCATKALHKFMPHVGNRTDAIKLDPGTKQSLVKILAARIIPGDGSSPADAYGIMLIDVVRNRGANGSSIGNAITIADRQRLDLLDRGWHGDAAGTEVRRYYFNPQDPLSFYVSPPVPAGGLYADVSWIVMPKTIPAGGAPGSEVYAHAGSSTETVGVSDLYEDEVWNYACAVLFAKDAKSVNAMARSQMHATAFISFINTTVQQLTGQNPNLKTLPFAPEVPGGAS